MKFRFYSVPAGSEDREFAASTKVSEAFGWPAWFLGIEERRKVMSFDSGVDDQEKLRKAILKGKLRAARRLLAKGKDLDMRRLLWTAVTTGKGKMVTLLLDNGAALAPEHLCYAAKHGHLKTVKLLLERGSDVNGPHEGCTPLHGAVTHRSAGQLDVVKCLLDHGADVNAAAPVGLTALQLAKQEVVQCEMSGVCPARTLRQAKAMVKLLSDSGAVPAKRTQSYCECGAKLTAVPGEPFRCNSCGNEWFQWQPPSYWISNWTKGEGGRDEEVCSCARSILLENDAAQAAIVCLDRRLWEWEAAQRGGASDVMDKQRQQVGVARQRIVSLGGERLWFRACMAMPPRLRHVASVDFDTAGNYLRGEVPE